MKFGYFDESATADGELVVVAGVIVDAQRMQPSKDWWGDLVGGAEETVGRRIREFHATQLYRGAGPWYPVPWTQRAEVIEGVIDWLARRRHHLVFSAGTRRSLQDAAETDERAAALPDAWCAAAFHIILAMQRRHQVLPAPKGHTTVIFDRAGAHEEHLCRLISDPPEWSEPYYDRRRNQTSLSQIIDVPYFGNSEDVLLIQLADLIAYILRRWIELEDMGADPMVADERDHVARWVPKLVARTDLPSLRPRQRVTAANRLFTGLWPAALQAL